MYNCAYCHKECKNKNSLSHHQRLCLSNPDRIVHPSIGKSRPDLKGKPSWNKGLNKYNDPRIAKKAESLSARYQSGELINHQRGKLRTAAEKLKISKTMQDNNRGGKRHGSGRGKKGWYKGFFCDSTYELVYIIYNIDHNIPFSKCNRVYTYFLDGKLYKYYPDFELADGTIIELKGYHTALVDLKTASVTDRPIQVLYEKDLMYAFDWVKNNYTYADITDLYE